MGTREECRVGPTGGSGAADAEGDEVCGLAAVVRVVMKSGPRMRVLGTGAREERRGPASGSVGGGGLSGGSGSGSVPNHRLR